MELLRIVAMFLILIVHADFAAIGAPSAAEINANPYTGFGQLLAQYLSVIGVNVFVLISGWFGIRSTIRGAAKLLFQCFFFAMLMYVVLVGLGVVNLSGSGIVGVILAYPHWFVVSYLGLMILAPPLNAFVEHVSRNTFKSILIAFFVFQTIYAACPVFLDPIAHGYSTFSFIGLYLLGRYVSIYKPINYPPRYNVWLYCGCAVINALLYIVIINVMPGWESLMGYYVNPLNILGACGLTFAFATLKLKTNNIINFISASAFAAYLLHACSHPLYRDLMRYLHSLYPGFEYAIAAISVIVPIFIVAVILDQPRKWLWSAIDHRFFNRNVSSAALR